jgi:hypothetical protein
LFEKQGGSENQQRADEESFHGVEILNLRLAAKVNFVQGASQASPTQNVPGRLTGSFE